MARQVLRNATMWPCLTMQCPSCCLDQQEAAPFFSSEAKQSYTYVEPATASAAMCQSPGGAVGHGCMQFWTLTTGLQTEDGSYQRLAKREDGISSTASDLINTPGDYGATSCSSPVTGLTEPTSTTTQSRSSTGGSCVCTGNARALKAGKGLQSENASVISTQSGRNAAVLTAIPQSVRLSLQRVGIVIDEWNANQRISSHSRNADIRIDSRNEHIGSEGPRKW